MMLHIIPKLFAPPGVAELATLVDLTVEPFGLYLRGGVELDTRHPFPNKRIVVACRKAGRKAVNGLLIQVPTVTDFEYTARWAVDTSFVSTHRVRHRLLDRDFDAISDDMSMWYAMNDDNKDGPPWKSRWPAWAKGLAPCEAQPMMEVLPIREARPATTDTYGGPNNRIDYREQTFDIPTIEPERFDDFRRDNRLPARESAFHLQ
jgi:Family of unknown function (DUF6012)